MSIFDRHGEGRGLARIAQESALGSGQPAHISILGSRFALIDAEGERYEWPALSLDVVILDINVNISRIYWATAYQPGDDGTPPDCWSDNGIAPSSLASLPQSAACAGCPQSGWTQVSQISGKNKPACSSKQKLAVTVLDDEVALAYLLAVPVMSIPHLKKYAAMVQTYTCPGTTRPADLEDVITRVSFVPGRTGELQFESLGWISSIYRSNNGYYIARATPGAMIGRDNPITNADDGGESFAAFADMVVNSKATRLLIGADDKPRLAGPPPTVALPAPVPAPLASPPWQEGATVAPAPIGLQGAVAAPPRPPGLHMPPPPPQPPPAPSGHGGPRAGSGRPKGSRNRRPLETVAPPPQPAQTILQPSMAAPGAAPEAVTPIRMGGPGDPAALGAAPRPQPAPLSRMVPAELAKNNPPEFGGPQAVNPTPAPLQGEGIPDFLRRQQQAPPGTYQNPVPASDELSAALSKAISLNTGRSQ